MKKLVIYLNLAFVGMMLFSCSQDEEVYSCDKEVDSWVKENLADIRVMDREDWLQIDERLNRAVYIAFAPEQKLDFWKEKISEVLSLNWNESERKHLESFNEILSNNSQWFNSDLSKNKEEFEKFEIAIYKWSEYACDNLGWDKNLVGSIIASGNKLLDINGKIQFNTNSSIRLKSGGEFNCNCHVGNVVFTTCGGPTGMYCSDSQSCEDSVYGCGAVWVESCNGICGYY